MACESLRLSDRLPLYVATIGALAQYDKIYEAQKKLKDLLAAVNGEEDTAAFLTKCIDLHHSERSVYVMYSIVSQTFLDSNIMLHFAAGSRACSLCASRTLAAP